MKISRSSNTLIEHLGLREDKLAGDVNHPAFRDILALSNSRMQKAEMDNLLRQIDQMGKNLSKQLTWRALMNYKEQIRKFLEQVVKGGFGIKEEYGFDRRGRKKLYKIVSEIDDLIAQLAEEVLKEQKNDLEILKKIGDIRGLLVNLYW